MTSNKAMRATGDGTRASLPRTGPAGTAIKVAVHRPAQKQSWTLSLPFLAGLAGRYVCLANLECACHAQDTGTSKPFIPSLNLRERGRGWRSPRHFMTTFKVDQDFLLSLLLHPRSTDFIR
jgi:hypothetical protein